MTPRETDPDLSVSVQESPAEAWVSGSLLQYRGHSVWQCMHGTFLRRLPLTSLPPPYFGLRSNIRKGTEFHPSTEVDERFTEHGPAHQNKTQEKGAVTPQETEPDLPVSVWQSLAEVRVNSGVPRGQGMTTTVLGLTVCWHKSF